MKVKETLAIFATIIAISYGFYFKEQQMLPSHASELRKNINENTDLFKALADYFHSIHLVSAKRCANLFDEGCSNGGIPGSGSDSDWINGGGSPGKRCANLFDEGCSNSGIPGSSSDLDWINGGSSPGRR